ncbi:MAG TPA: hypothetical protein VGZ02_08215 [Candidatus Baltobacteraceae bacterium]|jgi:carboxypeptidase C (cathepsin A)|nr:hypothetical protein [Candidatus Baltobacteraceae bacterium]
MKRFAECLLAVCACAAFLAPFARAATPAPKPSPTPVASPESPGETPDAVSEHTVTIGGRAIAYTARAGTITLRDERDEPTARVFYTAYTVEGENRPVTFLYNGGPGSSTMWLRMGSVGPVRVLAGDGKPSGPPPYRIADNPYSILDKTDLVFIDMPATGFGRLTGAGTPKMFFGLDADVQAFGQFIQRYITRFHRWNAPKFLFGESYGTTRSGALSAYLQDQGIPLNGIVLQSSILNYGLDYTNGDPIAAGDWPYVFYLPTEAATAWFHGKIRNRPADLGAFVAQVEQFGIGEYLNALYQGARLPGAQRRTVAAHLAAYLGVPVGYVLTSNLRVPYSRFQQELLRDRGIVVGRLDSRYQTYSLDRATNEGPPWDPTDSSIDGPYTTAINAYLRDDLKYETPLTYRTNIYNLVFSPESRWDFSHNGQSNPNVAPDLAYAMTQNPSLKVFSANGYYDFATPFFATQYTLQHLNIAPALRSNITYGFYEAGHMIYLSDAALAQYQRDLDRWYDTALSR